MPRIAAIKNFTANADLGSGNSFFRTTNFGFQPNEAVVRQISYSGPIAQDGGNFLVWCSITNDIIGCFNVGAYSTTVNPQTQLLLTSPLQNQIQFQIYTVGAGGVPIPYEGLVGDFSIQIDFLKY